MLLIRLPPALRWQRGDHDLEVGAGHALAQRLKRVVDVTAQSDLADDQTKFLGGRTADLARDEVDRALQR